jgi:hypothetical protein
MMLGVGLIYSAMPCDDQPGRRTNTALKFTVACRPCDAELAYGPTRVVMTARLAVG